MKQGFWASVIIFALSLAFLIASYGIEIGLDIAYPEGIPDSVPHAIEMQSFADAMQKYDQIDVIINICSLCSGFFTGLIARIKGISLSH